MTWSGGYTCACCDEVHQGEFPAIGFDAPAFWWDDMADAEGHELTSDTCVIPGVGFFVRAVPRIPVLDAVDDFEWGVWVSQSETNFLRLSSAGADATPGEETFGWLSTDLPGYAPSTLDLKTAVIQQAEGWRPLLEGEPPDHPLSVEQREGITVARVRELVAPFLTED